MNVFNSSHRNNYEIKIGNNKTATTKQLNIQFKT